MTLVVARRSSRTIRLCCDSKLSSQNVIHGGYLRGALKAVILAPNLCVAYAGDSRHALDAIRKLDRLRRLSANGVLEPGAIEDTLGQQELAADGT